MNFRNLFIESEVRITHQKPIKFSSRFSRLWVVLGSKNQGYKMQEFRYILVIHVHSSLCSYNLGILCPTVVQFWFFFLSVNPAILMATVFCLFLKNHVFYHDSIYQEWIEIKVIIFFLGFSLTFELNKNNIHFQIRNKKYRNKYLAKSLFIHFNSYAEKRCRLMTC